MSEAEELAAKLAECDDPEEIRRLIYEGIGDGEELYKSAEEALKASDGIEDRNADFMKTDAKMNELIAGAGEFVEGSNEQLDRAGVIMEEQKKLRNELYANGKAIRALLYAGRGALGEALDTRGEALVPEPPDTEAGTNEEWDAFIAEMKRTEPKFKAVMATTAIDAIKASPE
jgi:hypothetical protein